VLSSILIFVLYKTFIRQQKTYTVPRAVFDMQTELRCHDGQNGERDPMAGFGRIAGEHVPGVGYVSRILPVQFRIRTYRHQLLECPESRSTSRDG